MAGMKKLSGFRQLSLNCDAPQTQSKRPSLKKQFSEDLPDWRDDDLGIKITLGGKGIRNPFIKHAWVDSIESIKDEPVIIKKCSENRRIESGKFIRQGSLDKELLLNPKKDLAERLRQSLKTREEKPNLKIFLAQHSMDYSEEYDTVSKEQNYNEQPKLMPSLTASFVNDKNSFKIRKNAKPKTNSNTSSNLWQVPNKKNVPVIENELFQPDPNIQETNNDNLNDVKPIASVIIRPATAVSKREMFQKRTNSAFNSTINKDTPKPRRPLVRSSSAPCKPDLKSKLIFQKHRNKSFKKNQLKTSKTDELQIEDNPKSQKELNRTTAVVGNDVITMVSLVSPAGSDCEEESLEDVKMKTKNVCFGKNSPEPVLSPKIMSLRKAVKTVSFQQSTIHAIRSFSASFPARRASVSAAMMLNNSLNATTVQASKLQEKRATNSNTPDDDERVPKRRLVNNSTEEIKTASFEKQESVEDLDSQTNSTRSTILNVDSKQPETVKSKTEENETVECTEKNGKSTDPDTKDKEPELKSPKEKQCWNIYCKMVEKGINVSFDTILRGMLTPTEYRLSKKHLFAASKIEPPEST